MHRVAGDAPGACKFMEELPDRISQWKTVTNPFYNNNKRNNVPTTLTPLRCRTIYIGVSAPANFWIC